MNPDGPVRRITVFVGADELWSHRPLTSELVERAYVAGMAGATILRGNESIGDEMAVCANPILDPHLELPRVVSILDGPDKVEGFLAQVEEIVADGLIIIDDMPELPEAEPARIDEGEDGAQAGAPDGTADTPDYPDTPVTPGPDPLDDGARAE